MMSLGGGAARWAVAGKVMITVFLFAFPLPQAERDVSAFRSLKA